ARARTRRRRLPAAAASANRAKTPPSNHARRATRDPPSSHKHIVVVDTARLVIRERRLERDRLRPTLDRRIATPRMEMASLRPCPRPRHAARDSRQLVGIWSMVRVGKKQRLRVRVQRPGEEWPQRGLLD